jgi:hypothetical protein
MRRIFSFSPLLMTTYLGDSEVELCFLGEEVLLSLSLKTEGGGVLGLNLSSMNGKAVDVGGKNTACTASSLS